MLVLATAATAQPATPAVPARPAEPRAAKAYAAFDNRCAGCHQTGRLTQPAMPGDLDDILDLSRIASDRSLVRPGIPDVSPLFEAMLQPHPRQMAAGATRPERATSDELLAVADWIADLPGEPRQHDAAAMPPPPRVDLATAAAELAMSETDLAAKLIAISGPWLPPARRLLHSLVDRADANGLYEVLAGVDVRDPALANRDGGPILDLWVEPWPVAPGQELSLRAATTLACHLTIINVEADGKAIVVFPNDFQRDNLLPSGRHLAIPDPGAPYVLRLRPNGPERLIALCAPTAKPPLGITHDFERLRFTVLGNWRAFLRDRASVAPANGLLRRAIVVGDLPRSP